MKKILNIHFYENKLYKNNEAKIGKKIRANEKYFEAGKFKNKNIKKTMIHISFKNLLTKEWPEYRSKSSFVIKSDIPLGYILRAWPAFETSNSKLHENF